MRYRKPRLELCEVETKGWFWYKFVMFSHFEDSAVLFLHTAQVRLQQLKQFLTVLVHTRLLLKLIKKLLRVRTNLSIIAGAHSLKQLFPIFTVDFKCFHESVVFS